jgi:hypothetical protein
MGKDKQKKEKYEDWGKLGFAGLILKANLEKNRRKINQKKIKIN